MKKHIIILAMVFVIGGCAGHPLTDKTITEIDTAIGQVKDTHIKVLDLWSKNNEFIMAYIGNDLYKLSSDDVGWITEFTEIADTLPPQRTEWDLGHSMRLLHKVKWMGLREAITIFAPDLLSLLPGL